MAAKDTANREKRLTNSKLTQSATDCRSETTPFLAPREEGQVIRSLAGCGQRPVHSNQRNQSGEHTTSCEARPAGPRESLPPPCAGEGGPDSAHDSALRGRPVQRDFYRGSTPAQFDSRTRALPGSAQRSREISVRNVANVRQHEGALARPRLTESSPSSSRRYLAG